MKLLKQNARLIAFAVVMSAIAGYLLWTTTQPPDLPVATTPLASPKPPPPGETAESGHWHGDEWHATPHETQETLPAKPTSPVETYRFPPPDAVTKPVFPEEDPNASAVENAYKRLEYIKNNPYAWGGVHSERATELIAALMPLRALVDHNDGDELGALMHELTQQGDPRAAVVFAGLLSPTYVGFTANSDVLVEIGPPIVPYILPYLFREDTMGSDWIVVKEGVFESLSRISVAHRADLGGITDHIILPKIAAIAAKENNERYHIITIMGARKALALLGQ